MNGKQFDTLSRKYFGELLKPYGFSCDESRYNTFYRQESDDIYHFIIPELGGSGAWFHVIVFAHSPVIEPDFSEQFPDDLGFPNGILHRLHSDRGVGTSRTTFRCNKEEGFVRNFSRQAAPAVLEHALPYLDSITTLKELLPHIHQETYLERAKQALKEKN